MQLQGLPEFAKPLSEDPSRSYTLPADYYTDPAVYAREKEAIFYRTWHYVGHRAHFETPGNYIAIRIADQGVFGDLDFKRFRRQHSWPRPSHDQECKAP